MKVHWLMTMFNFGWWPWFIQPLVWEGGSWIDHNCEEPWSIDGVTMPGWGTTTNQERARNKFLKGIDEIELKHQVSWARFIAPIVGSKNQGHRASQHCKDEDYIGLNRTITMTITYIDKRLLLSASMLNEILIACVCVCAASNRNVIVCSVCLECREGSCWWIRFKPASHVKKPMITSSKCLIICVAILLMSKHASIWTVVCWAVNEFFLWFRYG